MLRGRPGGFRFNVDPVARMLKTHSRVVFRSGTGARRPSLKCLRKALCVAITDSLFLKNASTTKPRCSPDQPMALSENDKTAAIQRDHFHHCTPSTARAVTPPKVGVISAARCIIKYLQYKVKHPRYKPNGTFVQKNFTVTHFTLLYPQEHRNSLHFTAHFTSLHSMSLTIGPTPCISSLSSQLTEDSDVSLSSSSALIMIFSMTLSISCSLLIYSSSTALKCLQTTAHSHCHSGKILLCQLLYITQLKSNIFCTYSGLHDNPIFFDGV